MNTTVLLVPLRPSQPAFESECVGVSALPQRTIQDVSVHKLLSSGRSTGKQWATHSCRIYKKRFTMSRYLQTCKCSYQTGGIASQIDIAQEITPCVTREQNQGSTHSVTDAQIQSSREKRAISTCEQQKEC